MCDFDVRNTDDFAAVRMHAHAEIEILDMQEIAFVEPIKFLVIALADAHECAGNGGYFMRFGRHRRIMIVEALDAK